MLLSFNIMTYYYIYSKITIFQIKISIKLLKFQRPFSIFHIKNIIFITKAATNFKINISSKQQRIATSIRYYFDTIASRQEDPNNTTDTLHTKKYKEKEKELLRLQFLESTASVLPLVFISTNYFSIVPCEKHKFVVLTITKIYRILQM